MIEHSTFEPATIISDLTTFMWDEFGIIINDFDCVVYIPDELWN